MILETIESYIEVSGIALCRLVNAWSELHTQNLSLQA